MDADQSKFRALVEAYAADLYRYAFWTTHQESLAEDLVQETFMRAWRGIDGLHDPKAAKAWLWTILRREIARHYERRKRESNALDAYDQTLAQEAASTGAVERWALSRALKTLPEASREALLLQVIGGYSCEEIAEMVGSQPGAVMTRLSRTRQKLRDVLKGDVTKHKKVTR